jgi:hypothetical protein
VERSSVEAIVRALKTANVRYLIAGGLAVVAHGFVRFTADVDLVLDLDPDNLRRAIHALSSLGYRPRAPVEFERFADASERSRWVDEKGMTVFSLTSPVHRATEVDLFVAAPFDFEAVYARAARLEVAPGLPALFVALPDLIDMKRKAGRAQDLVDIERLENLRTPPEGGRPA